jgi:hypothetical protein
VIVGVVERCISEREIVLLANIVQRCAVYGGTESVRHRSRLSGPRSGGQFQKWQIGIFQSHLEGSSSRNIETGVVDAEDIQTRDDAYTETEIHS